ncbi:hypothetical protein T492DRAFT_854544 [Pavlovales sp. CCMP2436]|nr:hypothetical protein T492DRAFT_854544 [Pavlovales sp. CCMP2436]
MAGGCGGYQPRPGASRPPALQRAEVPSAHGHQYRFGAVCAVAVAVEPEDAYELLLLVGLVGEGPKKATRKLRRSFAGVPIGGAGGSSLLPAPPRLPAPAGSERTPAAESDEGVPRAPAADELGDSAPAAIKWSFRDLPRFAALFVERHGEADPTQLKPPQIRALALAMLSSDKKLAIDTIKRQLKVLKNAGAAAIIAGAAAADDEQQAGATAGAVGRRTRGRGRAGGAGRGCDAPVTAAPY